MLLLFSIRVAERPPVWERAVNSVYHRCLSETFVSFCVCVLLSFLCPSLEVVEEAYCFCVVRPSVCECVCLYIRPFVMHPYLRNHA